jgi:hypothetical protein
VEKTQKQIFRSHGSSRVNRPSCASRASTFDQLGEAHYASLYSEALNDPLLKRTPVELETAMSNAVEARKVVFELFQHVDGFRLDDYKAMGNPEEGMGALVRFIADAASAEGETFTSRGDQTVWMDPQGHSDRDPTDDGTRAFIAEGKRPVAWSRSSTRRGLPEKVPRAAAGGTRIMRPVARRH